MYCYKCGKEIPEGGSFCTYCGTSINRERADSGPCHVEEKEDVDRQTLVSNLSTILPYVRHVEHERDKIDTLRQQIIDNRESTERAQEGVDMLFGGSNYGVFLWLILVVACLIVEIPFVILIKPTKYDDLIVVIAVVVGTILYVKLNQKTKNSFQADCEKENREISHELEVNQRELEEYCKNNKVAQMIDVIPKEYCCEAAIVYILGTLRTGRAKDMQQALNLYEEYMFRQEVKEIQSQHGLAIEELNTKVDYQTHLIDAQGQQIQKQLSDVEKSAVKAKKAARVSTALGVYNMLKR